MGKTLRAAIAHLTALAIAAGPTNVAWAAPEMTRAEYEACQTRDETSFGSAIQAIATRALEKGVANVDYDAIIADEWRKGNVGDIIDRQVDVAIEEIRDEQSWGDLIKSLANKEKAQELAVAVAERVYRSDGMKTAIEGLAGGIGTEIGKRIELASIDAANPAIRCLEAFVGPRYGEAMARIVVGSAGAEFGVGSEAGGAEVTPGAVIRQGAEGITGAAVLLMRRQLANMAQRLGQRIVGSVLSRLVSVVAGGIGLVLIAKDVWELRNGVLPIIATEMKSKETKAKVQQELALSVKEQIGEHVKEIGAKTGERIVEIWREFRAAHAKALELAEGNDGFKAFLDGIKPAMLPRLDDVLALIMGSEGDASILKRLDDGSLREAVVVAPAQAIEMARDAHSLDEGLKWHALAGENLPKVADLGLHKVTSAENFSKESLARLLALDDRVAVTRLAAAPREARETLFELDTGALKSLARTLTADELATFSSYLTGLGPEPRQRVLKAVANDPQVMQRLASASVRDAILASRNQAAAVDMMLNDSGTLAPTAVIRDLKLVVDGEISPRLIWERHPAGLGLLALFGVLGLLFLRRLLFPARRTPRPDAV